MLEVFNESIRLTESLNTLNNLLNEQQGVVSTTLQSSDAPAPPEVVTPKVETDYIQILENNQMLLTCRECAKIFTTLEGLRCHKRVHSGKILKTSKEKCSYLWISVLVSCLLGCKNKVEGFSSRRTLFPYIFTFY